MKEIDLEGILRKHTPDSWSPSGIKAAMREAVESALDMAAEEARVIQLYDDVHSVSKQSILSLKSRIK